MRRARDADAARLRDVFLASARAAWSDRLPEMASVDSPLEDWRGRIADPEVVVLVAELDGAVAGLAVLKPTGDRDDDPTAVAKLSRLYTDPGAWGRGVGTALLAAAMDELRSRGYRGATLWTAEWARARAFYESRGWETDGATREKTYGGATFTEVRYRIAVGG